MRLPSWLGQHLAALRAVLVFTVLVGLAYPLALTTVAQLPGLRANANGSRAFTEALLAEDKDGGVVIGQEQVKEGGHLVDLCVDYVGRDGVADMVTLAGAFATDVAAPVVLDSTEPEVMEAGLEGLDAEGPHSDNVLSTRIPRARNLQGRAAFAMRAARATSRPKKSSASRTGSPTWSPPTATT